MMAILIIAFLAAILGAGFVEIMWDGLGWAKASFHSFSRNACMNFVLFIIVQLLKA